MATGNVTIQGNQSGGPAGSLTFGPLTATTTAAVGSLQVVALTTGANTITIPSGTTTCIITPPNAVNPTPNPTYGGTLTLKGVSGDTGIAIGNKYPQVLEWDATGGTASPATIVINASTGCTVEVWCQ